LVRLLVENAEEYKLALPETGIFEKFDCNLQITCPDDTLISEIEKISHFTRACINVVDIKVENGITKYGMIEVNLVEVPIHIAERRPASPFTRKSPSKPKTKAKSDTPEPKDSPDSDLTD
jgi:hypothetical protein